MQSPLLISFPSQDLHTSSLGQWSSPCQLSTLSWHILPRLELLSMCWWIDAFSLWCWRGLLRVPWTARRSNQSILEEINPEYSLEGLVLRLQYFGHLMWRWLIRKDPDAGKDWRQKEMEAAEEEMTRQHHQLNWANWGDSEGQGSLEGCSLWDDRVGLDLVTERQHLLMTFKLILLSQTSPVSYRFGIQLFDICTKWSEVAQSCPTFCDSMDCSLPGSSLHRILQARILEWVAISFSRGSSWPRNQTWVSHVAGRCFNIWATREAPAICISTFIRHLKCNIAGIELISSPPCSFEKEVAWSLASPQEVPLHHLPVAHS